MTASLRAANLGLGAGLVLLGVALPFAAFIDTGHAPGTDAFRLIQFHFVLTGAVSLWAASSRARALLGGVSFVFMLVNGWIALRASMADPAVHWAMGFGAASLFTFVSLLLGPGPRDPAAPEAAGQGTLVSPDFGTSDAAAEIRDLSNLVAILAVTNAMVFIVLVFGFAYFGLLVSAIVDRAPVDFGAAVRAVFDGAASSALFRGATTFIIATTVYALLYAAIAALRIGLSNATLNRIPDFNRSLDESERRFVSAAHRTLESRLAERRWPARFSWFAPVALVALLPVMFSVSAFTFVAQTAAFAFLLPERATAAEPLFSSGPFLVGGLGVGFLAGCALNYAVFQLIGARYPEFGAYLYAAQGWHSLKNEPRTSAENLAVLVRHVRGRRLDIAAPFDPDAHIASCFLEFDGLIRRSTLGLLALTAAASIPDVATYTIVDEAGVSYARYPGAISRRVAMGDLDRVELTCSLSEDDGETELHLGYALVEEGEFIIDILDEEESAPLNLARLEKIDGQLMTTDVVFAKTQSVGWLEFKRPGFITTCAEEIAARYDADLAPRLIRLMRADGAASAP